MIENRSVPPKTILPHIHYPDVERAIEWLSGAFGFREHYRYGDPASGVSGAQMWHGDAWIMVRRSAADESTPQRLGYGTQSVTVFVEDVEAHCSRAKLAGAIIIEEPHETMYGEFQYAATDLAGHHWLFSRHAHDVKPEAWGAKVANAPGPLVSHSLPRFCYMEIPAADVKQSVAFYEQLFGWKIRNRDTDRPRFDDAPGNISGAWVVGRSPARDPGLVPYVWVRDIDASMAKAAELGAVIIQSAWEHSTGGARSGMFRDPAGNVIGLYDERS
jgi:uncharacterized glyoxalase superfamily protein PhnB